MGSESAISRATRNSTAVSFHSSLFNRVQHPTKETNIYYIRDTSQNKISKLFPPPQWSLLLVAFETILLRRTQRIYKYGNLSMLRMEFHSNNVLFFRGSIAERAHKRENSAIRKINLQRTRNAYVNGLPEIPPSSSCCKHSRFSEIVNSIHFSILYLKSRNPAALSKRWITDKLPRIGRQGRVY